MQSAGWDNETGCLVESEQYITEMPNVCIRAVTQQEMTVKWVSDNKDGVEGDEKPKDEQERSEKENFNFYYCPIFTTKVNFMFTL